MMTLKKIGGAAVAVVGFILAAAPNAGAAPTDINLEASTLLTTRGDPNGLLPDGLTPIFIVPPGTGYDGVADIIVDTPSGFIRGSGVLVQGGGARYVLTAAHVVDHMVSMDQSHVFFNMPDPVGRTWVDIAAVYIQPQWDGNLLKDGNFMYGNDLAIIELAAPAPAGAQDYPIYRGIGEVGAVGTKLGYGRSGSGDQGAILESGTKRMGENRYDALATIFGDIFVKNKIARPLAGAQLAYDFDNGSDANDAFGVFLGIHDLGVTREVMAAPGDSGGPTFINGQVAGITSYGMRMAYADPLAEPLSTSDIDGLLNSSYGEFAVDTRVAYYAQWIDSVVPVVVPEPMTLTAMLLGLAGLVARYRYLRKR